jgi:hypothetical protein
MHALADVLAVAFFVAALFALVAYQDWIEREAARGMAKAVKPGTEQHRPCKNGVFMQDFANRLNRSKK